MTASLMSFQITSKEAALDFLQSVVVVDDRAYLDGEDYAKEYEVKPDSLKPVGRRSRIDAGTSKVPTGTNANQGGSDDGTTRSKEVEAEVGESVGQKLDAKTLIDAFAASGLVCAVLRPSESEKHNHSLESRTQKATQRADMVILDWQIGKEAKAGETALNLIEQIVSTDRPGRLRLIAVYTSNPDLGAVIESVKEKLMEINPNNDPAIEENFIIRQNAIKIVLYKKSGGIGGTNEERVVSVEELPDRLISDFAEMTQGLLSNVALKSLGALRENTHRIITKFNANLDAPYVSHRVLTNPSEEAEGHPIPLLTSEFNDILEDCQVSEGVSVNAIVEWIDYLIERGIIKDEKIVGMTSVEIKEVLQSLLDKGLEKEKGKASHPNWRDLLKALYNSDKERLSELTKLLADEGLESENMDMSFALLTTLKSHYLNITPILRLGSIIAKITASETQYLLCLQPLCDSIRIKKSRNFPFLPLKEVDGEDSKDFEVVLNIDGAYKKFVVKLNPYLLEMISFTPQEGHKEVRGKLDENKYFFMNESSTEKYVWIADLKFPQAQRIVNQFGSQIARVGLTESDWLRRMATPSRR